uniref:Ovule protein n=1 Tax=Loa loa TaxID=7209 RepID=A0A1I7VA29_LOALO
MMLSQIGEEKCNTSMVDLVLYSESDQIIGDKSLSNNYSTVFPGVKRKCYNDEKYSDDSSQKLLLRTLQEKFTSSKRFRNVLVLR